MSRTSATALTQATIGLRQHRSISVVPGTRRICRAAVADDAVAGRPTGPPSEAETAAQVARFAGQASGRSPRLVGRDRAGVRARLIGEFQMGAAVIDIASH